MGKFSLIGFGFWGVAAILLGFHAIAALVHTENLWKTLSLMDAVGEDYFIWVDNLSWAILQNSIDYIIQMPLYILLFCIGVLFFILNLFKKA